MTSSRLCSSSERAQLLQHRCSHLYRNNTSLRRDVTFPEHILVAKEHGLVICLPPKAGSTHFRTRLLHASSKYRKLAKKPDLFVHDATSMRPFGVSPLSDFRFDDALRILDNFTKVIVVRHPLVRVLSSYNDKLATIKPPNCHPYQKTLGNQIRRYLNREFIDNTTCVDDVTFDEFMTFFTRHPKLKQDRHWTTYEATCRACKIRYDHVLRLETSSSDEDVFAQLLTQGTREEVTQHAHRLTNLTRANDGASVRRYQQFANISREIVRKVEKLYSNSNYLFGYKSNWTQDGLMTSCQYDETNCC